MSRRNRIFLGILLLFALGVGFLLYRVAADLDPRYRESTEESMVDTAYLLAAVLETDLVEQHVDVMRLRQALNNAYRKRFEARIFAMTKRRVDLRVYVTDISGIVLYDSDGKDEGKDYSRWRDVELTLQGQYGARTTLIKADDPSSAVMYVSAPIIYKDHVVGVISLGRAVASQMELVTNARQKLFYVGMITLLAFLFLLVVLSIWLARPFGLTTDLIRIVRHEGLNHPGRIARRVKALMTVAFSDMRDALAGRSHTEEYVQTLTHELKSPLTAIRGAAEVLREGPPPEQRERFANNISEQVTRLQNLADRLLELATLEKRRTLEEVQAVDLPAMVKQVVDAMESAAILKKITLKAQTEPDLKLDGEPFLLYQALINLISNAIDFSPVGSTIEIEVKQHERNIEISVADQGPGVPDYALERVFEKFYSLRRPDSGRKSTGLGLAFVREIAHLHGGTAYLNNRPEGGACALITLPLAVAHKGHEPRGRAQ